MIVYAASRAVEDQAKRDIARALLVGANIAISAQILQEFYSIATSKKRLNMTPADALDVVRSLEQYPICPIDAALVKDAIALQQRYQVSYWDAAILVAAARMGCTTLYSEDLAHNQAYAGVTVKNPFVT